MEGGVATGFRHVERGKYDPRFFLVKKIGRRTEVKQIPMIYKSVNSGDVFIMDLGLTIYQFNGRHSSKVHNHSINKQPPSHKLDKKIAILWRKMTVCWMSKVNTIKRFFIFRRLPTKLKTLMNISPGYIGICSWGVLGEYNIPQNCWPFTNAASNCIVN